jgi:hypothetical protein
MGWRFRRSVKIAPGVRLNFGKSGVTSWSVGGRGARVTFGKRGVTRTMGIPGTGLSYTERISGPPRTSTDAALPVEPPEPDRFGLVRPTAPESAGVARLVFLGLAVALVPAAVVFGASLLWLSIVSVIVGVALPSRASTQARLDNEHRRAVHEERDRRQAQLVSAAEAATGDEAALRNVVALPAALELTDDEVDYGAMGRVRGGARHDRVHRTGRGQR